MLWRSFAVWFGLGGQLEEKIYNYFDVWNIGFRNVEMKVVGNEKNFDKEGKIHTLYLLSIQRRHQHNSEMAEGEIIILKKRYSDFFALNKEVLRFISKNRLKADKLPEMPPKLSPFGSQTSPKSRVARFDYYIKELMKIEGISTPSLIQTAASSSWSFCRSTATLAPQISTNRQKWPPICSSTARGRTSAISWTKLPHDFKYSNKGKANEVTYKAV